MDRHIHICKKSESIREVSLGGIQDALPKKWRGCQAGKNNKYPLLWKWGSLPLNVRDSALRTHMSSFVSYLKMDPSFRSRLTLTEPRKTDV